MIRNNLFEDRDEQIKTRSMTRKNKEEEKKIF